MRLENFSYGDTPAPETIADVVADLLDRGLAFDVSISELSYRYDVRQPVVRTLLTYLQLDEILEAVGANYAEYKFQLLRPIATILQDLGARRADLAQRIIYLARRGTIWHRLAMDEAVENLGVPRTAIVSILAELELRGHATIKGIGAREGFRCLPSRANKDRLCKTLGVRFQERQDRNIARIHQVLAFAQQRECLTRALLSYFGEDLTEDCDHCTRCRSLVNGPVPPAFERKLGGKEKRMLARLRAERHAALATPRQIARFLCGLVSPATSLARLSRHRYFGALADVPFAKVLDFVAGKRLKGLQSCEKERNEAEF